MGDDSKAARTVETGERKDRVLIVEDEDNARKGYEQLLQRWGFEVLGVGTAEDALAKFSNFQPDTLIADVELPGMNGLDLLKQLGDELLDVPAIIITGKGSEERAVAAIESGAFWYIEKPLKGPVLRALLDRALSKARDAQNLAVLQRQLREAGRLGDLVGGSKPMQEVMRIVEMAAPSSASVLITGETGSGKEIVARTIHKLSPRAERTVCGHQLFGDSRIADGKRNFRPRARRVHRRGGAAHRMFRTGRRRHAAAGRDRRNARADASETSARAGRPQGAAPGKQVRNASGRAGACGDQQRSGKSRGKRAACGRIFISG